MLRSLFPIVFFSVSFMARSQSTCDSVNTILGDFFQHQGAMFSVVASTPITLDHLSANLYPGTSDYSLHMRTGGYAGHTMDANEWTALDTVTVASANTTLLTANTAVVPIPLAIAMDAGDTVSFFLADQSANRIYSFGSGATAGQVLANDDNLGISVAYAMTRDYGTPLGTYEWSGRVVYCAAEGQGVPSLADAGVVVSVSSDAVTLNVPSNALAATSSVVELRDLGGRLVSSALLAVPVTHLDIGGLAGAPYMLSVRGLPDQRFAQLVLVP